MHSCTLDNHILKPSCLVFEIDLDEKWWYPEDDNYKPVFFGSNGYIRTEGLTDSLTFSLENCNKIMVMDHIAIKEEQWVIKRITQEELHLEYPNDRLVKYNRK
jgi:hypothetical protein